MDAAMRKSGSYHVVAAIRVAYPGQRFTFRNVFDVSLQHHTAHGYSILRSMGFTRRILTSRDEQFVVNGILLDKTDGLMRCGRAGVAFVYTSTYLMGTSLFAGYQHAPVLARMDLGPTTINGIPAWHVRRVLLLPKETVPVFADYYIARDGFRLVREFWRFAPRGRPTTASGSSWARANYSNWGEHVVVKLPRPAGLSRSCRRLFPGKTA